MTTHRLAMSVEEAAERLSIGRTMAYDLIRRGTLPSIKIGQRRLVTLVDLETYIESLRNSEVAA